MMPSDIPEPNPCRKCGCAIYPGHQLCDDCEYGAEMEQDRERDMRADIESEHKK